MTDESISGEQKPAGKSCERLLEIILDDIVNTEKNLKDDWRALNQFPVALLNIPVSAGREYRATQAGVDAAHKLTGQIWKEREEFRQIIKREAFDRLSFCAVGQSIQAACAHLPKESGNDEGGGEFDSAFYKELAVDYKNILDKLVEEITIDVDRHIPCTLFHTDQLVPAFTVGPVEFRSRAEWIDRFVLDQKAKSVVDQLEQGKLTINEVRQQALKPDSGNAIQEAFNVITFLRDFLWVGTIRTVGHEPRQSHWKTSIVVGLAIDAVGLLFHGDDAKRFTRAGRAHLFAEDRLATAVNGGRFIYGWSMNMPGLGSAPGSLAARMKSESKFLSAAGLILGAYLESRQKTDAPHLVEAWVNALYWVGEARREVSDSMAVTKYGCAVDVISGAGGKSRVITEFVGAALAPREVNETHNGKLSIAEAVKMVYEKGRSKLAHGETPGLLEDFSESRRVGDCLLANLFYVVTLVLSDIVSDKDSHVLKLKKKQAYRILKARLLE